jgi:hypothetical protein
MPITSDKVMPSKKSDAKLGMILDIGSKSIVRLIIIIIIAFIKHVNAFSERREGT